MGTIHFDCAGRALGLPLGVLVQGSAYAHVRAYLIKGLAPVTLWGEYKDECWVYRGWRLTKEPKPVGIYNKGCHWAYRNR